MKTIRLFISSPGDVAEEREKSKQVIESLQIRYADNLKLIPVFWENLALSATSSFQKGIDRELLSTHEIDIAIFILWSRMGTALTDETRKSNGSTYRSGTEREFDLMLKAFEESGGVKPVILAYTRKDEDGFSEKLDTRKASEDSILDLIEQHKLVKKFIKENFKDDRGRNLRAYHSYREPIGFAQRLHTHLRSTLDGFMNIERESSLWNDDPYRSLEVFDIHHMPIFCGRDEETCDLLLRLREQEAQTRHAFVCIVGASGSGKSSLARAGVAGTLIHRTFDDGVQEWRAAIITPSHGSIDLMRELVEVLAKQIPDLDTSVGGLEKLARRLGENPDVAADLLQLAFKHARDSVGGTLKVLLVVDQMEELWTHNSITHDQREQFMEALEALSGCGFISVLCTLRSDFYSLAQLSDCFLRLKGDRGHLDLVPPGPAALQELIIKPAHRSGLSFERHPETGHTLDRQILEDAAKDPSALPLLQFTLAELYAKRDLEVNQLTYDAYNQLDGVEGALKNRLLTVFNSLDEESRGCLDEILPLLVTVDTERSSVAARRRASMADLAATPARKALTTSLIEARFLTSSRDREGNPEASLAHESLLRTWPQLTQWLEKNLEHLRLRTQIEQSEQRWNQAGRNPSLLLNIGLPLDEGEKLLHEAPTLLTESTVSYVKRSIGRSFEVEMEAAAECLETSKRIGTIHPDIWEAVVAAAFGSTSAQTRRHVALLLASMPDQPFENELVHLLLTDPDNSVRQASAFSLVSRGNRSAFNRIRETGLPSGRQGPIGHQATTALGTLLAISDMQTTRPEFELWIQEQDSKIRRIIHRRSLLVKIRQALPLFLFIIIPSAAFAAAGSAMVKWLPSAFNFSCVQATASFFMGIFHSFPSGIILGGSIVTGLTIYRLVFGKEHENLARFRPYPAIGFGALFALLAGVLCVVMVALVYQPEALQQMGWTNTSASVRPPLGPLLYEVLVRNRSGLAFPLTSVGLGIALALMTNRLRASSQWQKFVDSQSAITGIGQMSTVVAGVIKVIFPFAYPIIAFVPAFALLAYILMDTGETPSGTNSGSIFQVVLGGMDQPLPEEIQLDNDDLKERVARQEVISDERLGRNKVLVSAYQSKQVERRSLWKRSCFGRTLGLFGDTLAKMFGGYFSIVGMGLGIVLIRHGINIAPKKLHG